MRILILFLSLVILSACTPMIYGVPQERWDLMSEKERIVIMEAYKERQIAYRQAAADRARIRAEQEAIRDAQRAEELRILSQRVDLIYDGRTGTYGDLIRVTLSGGKIRVNGKKRHYEGISFKIADGELKSVPIYYSGGRKAELYILYKDRHLWLDTDSSGQNIRRAGHLTYSDKWSNGITYNGINSHGSRDMRGVNVEVEVIPIRRGRHHSRNEPFVIIKERIVQAPPQVIIKEKIVQRAPKVIVKEKVVQAPPQKVVIKEKVIERQKRVDKKTEEGTRQQKGVGGDNVENSELSFKELKEKRQKERKQAKQIREEIQEKAEDNKRDMRETVVKAELSTAKIVLNGGMIRINGKHRPFNPVKFSITEGETKTINLTGGEKSATRKAFTTRLIVSYVDGQIYFDGKPGAASAYRASARNKKLQVSTGGPVSMHKVQVKINIE